MRWMDEAKDALEGGHPWTLKGEGYAQGFFWQQTAFVTRGEWRCAGGLRGSGTVQRPGGRAREGGGGKVRGLMRTT